MKKITIFLCFIVIIFISLIGFTNFIESKKLVNSNPYGDKELNQATIFQLDDKNYQNIITPGDLTEKLQGKEAVYVYFYSPICGYCQMVTPELMAASKNTDTYIHQYNLLEFEKGFNEYNIKGTPTLVKFENGKEISRLMGAYKSKEYESWIIDNK